MSWLMMALPERMACFPGVFAGAVKFQLATHLAILVPAASVGATLIPLASLLAGGRPASMIVAVSLILLVALAVRLLTIKIPHAIPGRAGGQHGAARDEADRAG